MVRITPKLNANYVNKRWIMSELLLLKIIDRLDNLILLFDAIIEDLS